MAANHSTMRLGKRPRRDDPRTLKLARYLLPGAWAAAIAPPSSCDYTRGIKGWGMMLNDKLGCCTIAAVGHAVQIWTANASKEITVPDSTILSYYERWDGYNPQDASTDRGGVELDVLNDWRQQGFSGHSLDAYVSVGLGNREQGTGNKGQGTGNREQGTGNKGQGIGNREQGTGNKGQGTGNREQGTGNKGQGIGNREQGTGNKGQGTGNREQGTGNKGQGIGNKGQGIGNREQGIEAEVQNPTPSTQGPVPSPQPPTANSDIALAIWLFGGAYIGVQLPITAQNQNVWDVPQNPGPNDEPGSWGGHAIYLVGYDTRDTGSVFPNPQSPAPSTQSPTFTCITWGKLKRLTWAWLEKYCDEAYALVSKDWIKANGIAPSGFDFATLEADLKLVTA